MEGGAGGAGAGPSAPPPTSALGAISAPQRRVNSGRQANIVVRAAQTGLPELQQPQLLVPFGQQRAFPAMASGASSAAPRSGGRRRSFVRRCFSEPVDGKVTCDHCSSTLSCSNISDLKNHLFSKRCTSNGELWIDSEAAAEVAQDEPEVRRKRDERAAALARYRSRSSGVDGGAGSGGGANTSGAGSSTADAGGGPTLPPRKKLKQGSLLGFRDSMTPAEQHEAQVAFARMLLLTATPLNFAEQPAVQDFFHKLRPAFQIPSR